MEHTEGGRLTASGKMMPEGLSATTMDLVQIKKQRISPMILGIYGYHDTGKTLFLEKLMKELKKKDTGRLAIAGFNPVIGVAEDESVIHIDGKIDVWESIDLVHRLAVTDVILVEGFKNEPMEKIAVGDIKELPGTKFRSEQFKEILAYIEETIEAERAKLMVPCCCGEDSRVKKKQKEGEDVSEVKIKIVVNGKKLPANEFVQSMFWETLCGMARSLKGVDKDIESIEITASKE
jgi:molybdopterin-guanine dinucleotide biosynthesis protein